MTDSITQITAAEISRLAGVTRATVSNWRRRHPDFPVAVGGTDTSPTYDLDTVRAWLAERGQLPESTPEAELRLALQGANDSRLLARQLLPLVSPLAQLPPDRLVKLADLPDEEFAAELATVVGEHHAPDLAAHALVRCCAARGHEARGPGEGAAETALQILAEPLTDTTSTGTYSTPQGLADLMVALPGRLARTLDPACGGGGLLSSAARAGAAEVLGQEIVNDQAALARVRAELAAPDARVCHGNSLVADAFPDERADAVVCNPPFGLRDWGHDDLAYDPRWVYGFPQRSESELAWVQHCLAHLSEHGTAVVLMPPGAAERSGGRRIRAELVRTGALRAVIALPQGAAPPLHVSLQLWVLTPPPDSEPKPVLFVDASDQPGRSEQPGRSDQPGRVREIDWDAVSERVLPVWRAFREDPENVDSEPGRSGTRSVVDLLDDTVDLTPQRHVWAEHVVEPERHDAVAHELRERLRRAGDALTGLGDGRLWQPAGPEPAEWRTATVADLLRGGALTLYRVTPARKAATPGVDEPAVLTRHDVRTGEPPSGSLTDKPVDKLVPVEPGDVVLPETLHHTGPVTARVAGEHDAGSVLGPHLFLLRPDPDRLDSEFLAGFLAAEHNVHGATTGTSVRRLDVKRLRVPLMPLERQRDYGHTFRRVRALNSAADLAATIARELAGQWARGLTSGALLPPDDEPLAPAVGP
ncbi:N-6 DNA Methylase [Prauserella aidingensis]|uniref:N-6 DNA methylase n=1 Tax=Prauserella aidingensis TaxID=387890 RepID=UPI0020A30A77|nr:N-6 DNA methylase [Prauserella aidingensis]MCP2255168.1 N-6 DNA Methylase [Prauserella aidingensis]